MGACFSKSDFVDIDNPMVFYNAVHRGQLHRVRTLVTQYGVDLHDQCDLALRWSCEEGHLETVRCLVELGANVRAVDDQPICTAAYHGHRDVVLYLIEHGANAHARHDQPLQFALRHQRYDIAAFLRAVPYHDDQP